MSQPDIETLKQLLAIGKTRKEIMAALKLPSEKAVDRFLHSFRSDQFGIFTSRHANGEVVHLLRPLGHISKPIIEPKIWTWTICHDPTVPYMHVQMPPGLEWKKILIVPIADVQYGHGACDIKKLIEYVNWILKTPNVFTFLNGDLFDMDFPNSPGGAIFEQRVRPREQPRQLREILAPIAHRILWGGPGNHEGRSMKLTDLDPLAWMCESLEIPYFDQPVYVDISWNNHVFSFFAQHGTTSSRTEGGKLNAAVRPVSWTEFTMFYVMSHVHDDMANPITRRSRILKVNAKGEVVYILEDRDQYVVITPAWMNYWGTYAARAGYAPPSSGAVTCYLNADGTYGVSG
jgi:hypothetical protein